MAITDLRLSTRTEALSEFKKLERSGVSGVEYDRKVEEIESRFGIESTSAGWGGTRAQPKERVREYFRQTGQTDFLNPTPAARGQIDLAPVNNAPRDHVFGDALGAMIRETPAVTTPAPASRFTQRSEQVSAGTQRQTLDDIVTRVTNESRLGGRPLVRMSLDNAAVMPVDRTVSALKVLGQRYQIPEFSDPVNQLPALPGNTAQAFKAFVQTTRLSDGRTLAEKYRNVDWGRVDTGSWSLRGKGAFGAFQDAMSSGSVSTDRVTPGLPEFVQRVRQAGGDVVFDSNRPESQSDATRQTLTRAGIRDPKLLIGNSLFRSDDYLARSRQEQLNGQGTTVAVVDSHPGRRDVVGRAASGSVLSVPMAVPGFVSGEEVAGKSVALSTFERPAEPARPAEPPRTTENRAPAYRPPAAPVGRPAAPPLPPLDRRFTTPSPDVSAEKQNKTLDDVVAKVAALRTEGKKGLVRVDLDLTSLMPIDRIVGSLKSVGQRFNIEEFKDPLASLPMIPGYTNGAFKGFVESVRLPDGRTLPEKYPDLDWKVVDGPDTGGAPGSGAIYNMFRGGYWGAAPMQNDRVTPGLADFVKRVRDAGGEVVFDSARGGGQRDVSLDALSRSGIENPTLMIGHEGGSDQDVKRQRQKQLDQIGVTVAVFDDRGLNREAVQSAVDEKIISVPMAIPGFSHTPDVNTEPYAVSTFERRTDRQPPAATGRPVENARPPAPVARPAAAPLPPLERRFTTRSADVSAEKQNKTLDDVVAKVAALRTEGKKGLVRVDLDLTSLMPIDRIVGSLKRVGERFNIEEFKDPLASLSMIPGYTNGAFKGFVENVRLPDGRTLPEKYPDLDWKVVDGPDTGGAPGSGEIYNMFRGGYWGAAPMQNDRVTPGLAEFVKRVRDAGGEVVFDSARGGGDRNVSLDALSRSGIENPTLMIGHEGGSDQDVKRQRQKQLDQIGVTVAVFDDRGLNREAVQSAVDEKIISVPVAIPGFSHTPDVNTEPYAISTFEHVGGR